MGYGEAPWHFRGRALYQLSLVPVEEVSRLPPLPPLAPTPLQLPAAQPPQCPAPTSQARKYVPPELPLVNLFGYTLGGFYLARYSGRLIQSGCRLAGRSNVEC